MAAKKRSRQEPGLLPNGEPRIGPPDRGVLLSPEAPNRIGFVCQRVNPRVNEEGALQVCSALVAHLSLTGLALSPPERPDGPEAGVDCIAHSPSGPLHFQVTRACIDPALWEYLATHKGVMVYTTPEEIAENLRSAILHKAQRTPPTDRHKLTLVLDASDLMAHCAPIALERFMTLHSEEVRALGFASIWLSGGFDFLVFRLDLAG